MFEEIKKGIFGFFNNPSDDKTLGNYIIGFVVCVLFLAFLPNTLSSLISFFVSIFKEKVKINFEENKEDRHILYDGIFKKDNFEFDLTNHHKPFEVIKFRYPNISFNVVNKQTISIFPKFYQIEIKKFKINPRQVFNIKPDIPVFIPKYQEIEKGSDEFTIEFENCGFNEITNVKIDILDSILKEVFETKVTEIRQIDKNEKKKISILNINNLVVKDTKKLEFSEVKIRISYISLGQIVIKEYSLTHPLYKYEKKQTKIIFDSIMGFYLQQPPAGLGGGADREEVQAVKIFSKDFVNQKSKKYVVEINRKLDGNSISGSIERLNFQIIPDISSIFEIKLCLLDESKKQISNKIQRKYETLFINSDV
jgi:hypothetical protein